MSETLSDEIKRWKSALVLDIIQGSWWGVWLKVA